MNKSLIFNNIKKICLHRRFISNEKQRFYKKVSVVSSNGNYEINLDTKKLKTPHGNILQIPNEALAMAVANEWSCVKEKIVPGRMHLSGLTFTVLDNPNHLSKWDIANKTLEYFETDTLLYRDESSEELMEEQLKHWDPVLNWFNKRFDINLETSAGICALSVPPETQAAVRRYLLSHDIWAVTGFWFGVEILKSVILAIATAERKLTVEQAVNLSRLEVNYQASHWGSVEWAHDIEKFDQQARFAAAILFIHLNTYNHKSKSKVAM